MDKPVKGQELLSHTSNKGDLLDSDNGREDVGKLFKETCEQRDRLTDA